MNNKIIEDFNEKGCLFLNNVYDLNIIEKFNEEIRNYMNKNGIYTHLTKKQDVQEETFYVNNSYMSLNSYQKIQYYYLPVIDNRGGYNRTTDVGMIDIYNANKLFPSIFEYFNINVILSILKKISGNNWKLLRTNIQICSNVINPNSFHSDNNDKCIKYVIYLSDILSNDCGPPVYIEKTHIITNNIKNNDIKTFLGKKGDVFISYQNGMHRKMPQNNSTVGFLVFNFILSKI